MASKWKSDVSVQRVGGSSKVRQRFTQAPKSNIIAAQLTQELTFRVGIPEELVDNLQYPLRLSNGKTSYAKRPDISIIGRQGERATVGQAGLVKVDRVVKQALVFHEAYYKALLRGVDNLLRAPGIPMRSGGDVSRNVNLKVTASAPFDPLGKSFTRNREIALNMSWDELAQRTLKDKSVRSRSSQVFWRHTGHLSFVYHRHMMDQLARLTPESFIGRRTTKDDRMTRLSANAQLAKGIKYNGKTLPNQYYQRATFSVEIGIPLWDTVMDNVITYPMVKQTNPALAHLLRNQQPDPNNRIGARQRLRKRFSSALATPQNVSETDISAIINPESRRPWLRQLARKTGTALFEDIKRITVL